MDALASSQFNLDTAGSDGAAAVVAAPPARGDAIATRSSEAAPLSIPPEPASLIDSGLPRAELESLVLKILLQRGTCTGSVISEAACMPRAIISETMDRI